MDPDFVLYQALTDSDLIRTVISEFSGTGGKVLVRSGAISAPMPLISRSADVAEMLVDQALVNPDLFQSGKKISVWFDTKDSGYFFECVPRIQNSFVVLAPQECLFRQQRRSEFRYIIPDGYSVSFPVRVKNKSGWSKISTKAASTQQLRERLTSKKAIVATASWLSGRTVRLRFRRVCAAGIRRTDI